TNYESVCERYGGCVYDSFVLFSNLCKYLCFMFIQPKPQNAITIAVSSCALLEREQDIYEQQGMEDYLKYQIQPELEPFAPGPTFPFIKVNLTVNSRLRELYPDSEELFDVVLMTSNHAHVGLRLINSINHYLKSKDSTSATVFSPRKITEVPETQLRVAFDGDDVLFSDESERLYKTHGLDKFLEHEKAHENKPLDHGPLKGFLEALGKLQQKFYPKGQRLDCPIRTYLVTACSAASSGTRALKTLRSWGLETDEALFLAGAPKGPMLEKIRPHIVFGDQMFHVEGAAELGTVAAHVLYGVAQKVNTALSIRGATSDPFK
uniref:5'-nucleotidase, cytosolic IAb n=1 Tax=Cyprinus carpio TaxID=7962 RepID=A0A8C1P2A5_CYPCA